MGRYLLRFFHNAVVSPLVEVTPDGAFGWEILREIAPPASSPQDVEDGIEHVAKVGLARPTAGVDRQVRLDQRPLGIAYIAGVDMGSHKVFGEL